MTPAAITGHWAFRWPSVRCTARTDHSAELLHRTTKVRGAMQFKGSSHRLRTGGVDPEQSFEGQSNITRYSSLKRAGGFCHGKVVVVLLKE